MAKPDDIESSRSHGEPARRPGHLRRPRTQDRSRRWACWRSAASSLWASRPRPPPPTHAATTTCTRPTTSVDDARRGPGRRGTQTFRFDTFGDEEFWGDTLHLNQAIAGAANGGVGPGVSPKTALVGRPQGRRRRPARRASATRSPQGQVNLDDPAVTLALLKLNSVVGVKGFFDSDGSLRSVGIECALCHSTVDDSFAPGIGKRLDGWANRDLNVGAIVVARAQPRSRSPTCCTPTWPTVKKVLAAWGPGKFDAELFLDGKAFRPDGKTAATLIPPAFGLLGVNLHT